MMTKKMSNQNTSKLNVGSCRRCGRSKRLSKLVMTQIGPCCANCSRAITDKEDRREQHKRGGPPMVFS